MHKKNPSKWEKHLDFIILDILCLELSFLLAYLLYQGSNLLYAGRLYKNMAIAFVFIDFVVALAAETFRNVLKRGLYIEFIYTIKHAIYVCLLGATYLFLIKSAEEFSRMTFVLTGFIYVFIAYAVRLLWRRHLHRKMSAGGRMNLLIVSGSAELEAINTEVISKNYGMYSFSGIAVIDKDMVGEIVHGIPVIANRESLITYLTNSWVDEVLFSIL